MAITGNATYIPTMNEFLPHWAECDVVLAPQSLLVRLENNTAVTQAQFEGQRNALQAQQNLVQGCLIAQQIARGDILLQKMALLTQFHLFNAVLDGYYQNTDFYAARPLAPGVAFGQEVFTRPMVDAMLLWARLNEGAAPAGVVLPIVLGDGTEQGPFASAVAALQFAYATERDKAQELTLARAKRNRMEVTAYETMKFYREAVPGRLAAFPDLVETLPRLTPLPGHTPEAVNASAIFQAPNASRVAYAASSDAMLDRYELRGTVGDHYDAEDAVVIATNAPGDEREFVTQFGLNQPGAEIALKVFVILTTGNEAGSAAMLVERPANVQLLAA